MPTTNPINSTIQASRVRELVDDTQAAVAAASKVRTELEASRAQLATVRAAEQQLLRAEMRVLEEQLERANGEVLEKTEEVAALRTEVQRQQAEQVNPQP